MSIAGVVILYYPDVSINKNILSYLSFVEKLYIFDNSEMSQRHILSDSILEQGNKVHYENYQNNFGIAESLNKVCRKAKTEGFDWILTMDQDSNFQSDNLSKYLIELSKFQGRNDVAMFGIQHYHPNSLVEKSSTYKEVNMLITSGSLLNLQQFDNVGGFDENLFIDEVDSEYCFRAVKKGLKIILFEKILLNHQLGITKNYRSLKSLSKTPRSLHSPIRIYYMVRNHLYVYKIYRNDFLNDLKFSRSALINRLKNNLIYGKSRIKTLNFIIKAVFDFKNKKMGKITLS